MKDALLQNILTRLYVKASHGLPLRLNKAESEMYSAKESRVSDLIARLNNGGSLVELLEAFGKLSEPLIRIIRTGENNGRLAEAIKATLEEFSLGSRLRFHSRVLQLYLAINLCAVLLFLLNYSWTFQYMYTSLFGTDLRYAGIYTPLLLLPGGTTGTIILAIGVILVPVLFRNKISKFLLSLVPPLARNIKRISSLEIETNYQMLRSSGYSPDVCLERLASDSSSAELSKNLAAAVASIRNGETVSTALAPVIAESGLEAFCTISVAENSADPAAALSEHISFTTGYLKEHLAEELSPLIQWASVACGVVAACAVCYVFKGILYSYTFLEMLP